MFVTFLDHSAKATSHVLSYCILSEMILIHAMDHLDEFYTFTVLCANFKMDIYIKTDDLFPWPTHPFIIIIIIICTIYIQDHYGIFARKANNLHPFPLIAQVQPAFIYVE